MTEYSSDIRERIDQLKAEYEAAFAASGATLPVIDVPEPSEDSVASWFYDHATSAYQHATAEVKAGHTITADWYQLRGAALVLAGDLAAAVTQ